MIHSKHQLVAPTIMPKSAQQHQQQNIRKSVGAIGTRRIFTTGFKIQVLDSYRHDKDCRQNQRATARKYNIHRRQIQKWLQCEEQLRSSVENGNTGTVSSTTVSPVSVSKSDSTVTEATGNTVTPARYSVTPALNLNLDRQHGDELTTQQGPPPSHPPHGSAPSSPQFSLQTTTAGTAVLPLCLTSVNYQEYSSEQRLRLYEELDDRVHVSKTHGYSDTQVDQDRSYYVLNRDGQRDAEAASAFSGRNEVKVYQTLTSYHSPHQEPQYNVNDINNSTHNHSPNHHPREQSYGNVDSFDGRSYSLLLAPSMIKTEPASPDTTATSGPYEPMGSPDGLRAPLSPVSYRSADSGSSSSVRFVDSPRAPANAYLHVHAHEHAHTCTSLDSEKPIPSLLHKQERKSEETMQHVEEKREEEIQEKTECCRTLIKEEVHLDEEEANALDEREEAITSSCVDYQRPPVGETSPDQFRISSGSVSPVYDCNGYSLPSSPPDSAGRSRNNWSDSEMDPLIPSNSLNSSGNFTRRRSFPLRFKLNVLNAFHRDEEVKENQRATARKFNINRRQVQKWLEQEEDIRKEIKLRGNSHQQLDPIQDVASGDSPLDLTTTSSASLRQVSNFSDVSVSFDRPGTEHEQLPAHFSCDVSFISSQHPLNYRHCTGMESSSEVEYVAPCSLSCSADSHTTMSTFSYQELPIRESCYTEPSIKTYSSSRANSVISNFSEGCEQRFSPLKRHHCILSCCSDMIPSSKRFCERFSDVDDSYDIPSQDEPLCLVKPKLAQELSRTELITKSISTVSTSNNPDAITFKPYLDNPVSKPIKKCAVQRLSPVSSHNINNNIDSNCQIICNFNEDQNRDYDFELNLRVPWRPDLDVYRTVGFPQKSTFVSVSSYYM